MKGYSYESFPTEHAAFSNLLYISNYISYKPRNELSIYKPTELESTFTEILNPKKANMIVGCIYCHPHKDLKEFNDYYVNNHCKRKITVLLWINCKRKITVLLLGDFNIDSLNYEQNSLTKEYLASLSSHVLLPHIVQPIRIRNNSKSLIDNIYPNIITPNNISGKITATILNHLP